jgi:two-component system, chemotaxis family, sensor kinase CheA
MSAESSELLAVFLAEVHEQLQMLEQEILKLERNGESVQTIQSIFRVAHTLKGSSAAMGFIEMKHLTHEMEDILDKIRNQELPVSGQVVDALFLCLDALSQMSQEIESGIGCKTSIDSIIECLQQLKHAETPGQETFSKKQASTEFAVTDEQLSNIEPAQRVWICKVEFHEACEMKLARAHIVWNRLKELGLVLSVNPMLDLETFKVDLPTDQIEFLLATEFSPEIVKGEIGTIIDVLQAEVIPVDVEKLHALTPSYKGSMPNTETKPIVDTTFEEEPKAEDEVKKIGQTIRVDVERLESLMNLVGELVIDQTRIAQAGNVLRDRISDDEALDDLEQISNHISRVIGELQESVMKTRMLPIEQLFNRFPRMVRDLSKSLQKEIDLIIEGKETELDRTVIEEIGDPLIHLIRNSIDHGVEDADTRRRIGKPACGTVRIKAAHQENQVVLTIEDDGAGINILKVKDSAIEKGLISSQQADSMTEQELSQLIFLPGFSTAREVSDISGRGVGLDIVRNHIEKLHGIIDLESESGKGTKFTIKLPLTLAILRGLLIKLKDTTYALPMSSVIEIVRLPKDEIQSIKGQSVVKIREKVLPLTWLHDHFKIQRSKGKSQNIFVVIVGVAEKRLGLVVDELVGNQEIVVKSVGSYVGKIEGVSGATILGDGSVALILDITGIFKLVSKDRSHTLDELEEVI